MRNVNEGDTTEVLEVNSNEHVQTDRLGSETQLVDGQGKSIGYQEANRQTPELYNHRAAGQEAANYYLAYNNTTAN